MSTLHAPDIKRENSVMAVTGSKHSLTIPSQPCLSLIGTASCLVLPAFSNYGWPNGLSPHKFIPYRRGASLLGSSVRNPARRENRTGGASFFLLFSPLLLYLVIIYLCRYVYLYLYSYPLPLLLIMVGGLSGLIDICMESVCNSRRHSHI